MCFINSFCSRRFGYLFSDWISLSSRTGRAYFATSPFPYVVRPSRVLPYVIGPPFHRSNWSAVFAVGLGRLLIPSDESSLPHFFLNNGLRQAFAGRAHMVNPSVHRNIFIYIIWRVCLCFLVIGRHFAALQATEIQLFDRSFPSSIQASFL